MGWYLVGKSVPFKASEEVEAARFLAIGAPDTEGLMQVDVPAADSDPYAGVSQSGRDADATVDVICGLGSIVEVEVAAAVTAKQELMIDVTGGAEGRVKPATTGKQVVAIAVTTQATVGSRCSAMLCRYIKP